MALVQMIDIDEVLAKWAAVRLGADHVIDKIDTSKVEVAQGSMSYRSSQDWWRRVRYAEQFYDNDTERPATFTFSETMPFDSQVTWTLTRAFRSTRHLVTKVDLQFPVAQEGRAPLQVQFATSGLEQKNQKSDALQTTWRLNREVKVAPYTSMCARAVVRTCRLQEVAFATDVSFSGTIRVVGYKKGRKWNKQEVTASIADALGGKEAMGFNIIENDADTNAPARQAVFRVEGLCSGEVGIEADLDLSAITSLV